VIDGDDDGDDGDDGDDSIFRAGELMFWDWTNFFLLLLFLKGGER